VGLSDRQQQLLSDLRELRSALRDRTRAQHQRLNPFVEDLADWQERGRFWAGEDRDITIYDSATLIGAVEIGRGTWVGPFCLLDGSGGLRIGEFCSIATGVQVLSHDTVRWALSGGREAPERTPTSIGNRCFIGTHAVVLRGSTIGDGCVLAAGSVVSGEISAGSIVAGVPGRRIGAVAEVGGEIELQYDAPHGDSATGTNRMAD
jgi:acetyltransferase-like isoleucine patch superfamily enzyme